jgi:uncharacterized protein (TIGR02453 family)
LSFNFEPLITPSTIRFLKALKKNNNKIWFDENKDQFLQAKTEFSHFTEGLLQQMLSFDNSLRDLEAKNCLFRINRDIRFSKDKTPYKVHFSAAFIKGGKKAVNAGYYFHLQPGGKSFAGGGLWMPAAPELKKLRQEIDYNFNEFTTIISHPNFKKHYGGLEKEPSQMLVNTPKGYEKDHPAAEFLKMKSFVATKYLPDETVLLPSLTKEAIDAYQALYPLIQFINRAFES